MTYRELIDNLQMMTEMEPALLNSQVMASYEDCEYFSVNNIMIDPLGNQFHGSKQPVMILGD